MQKNKLSVVREIASQEASRVSQVIRLPVNVPVHFISQGGITVLTKKSVTLEKVGGKAIGLASLPSAWTLPFACISLDLYEEYKLSKTKSDIPLKWAGLIEKAILSIGISKADEIIIRSSAISEGLTKRGKFHSSTGAVSNLASVLEKCLSLLLADRDTVNERIPLVIQKYCSQGLKGHLSNERRFYKESRDWIGERELENYQKTKSFQINLRNWRQRLSSKEEQKHALKCPLAIQISAVLKIPAAWCFQQKARVHFEWVWDKKNIYIVQADQEFYREGIKPSDRAQRLSSAAPPYSPQCLKAISKNSAEKYSKINNVFIYLGLKMPITQLYVLDEKCIIENLSKGIIDDKLNEDLKYLTRNSLVIRTDVTSHDQSVRQLLPRTNEVRNLEQARQWLVETSKGLINKLPCDFAFIFHNFISSLSSAFAYAAPDERNVQIEGLWGLPEGLYYNSHDQYLVDTKNADIAKIKPTDWKSFTVHEKTHFKSFFVCAEADGQWATKPLAIPYDWAGSLKEDWCKQIAYDSRRIASKVGTPVSIMWFAGLSDPSIGPVMPWHHEYYDPKRAKSVITARTKKIIDESFIVHQKTDLDALEQSATSNNSHITRIRIQPTDETLLRDKETLKKIGTIAKDLNATIVLEGGILSHAYYQLVATEATVEVVHPFLGFEERQEFNKLVRDKVPLTIEKVGENVITTSLQGEALIKALRDKLVEESFEVLDATDSEEILTELADLSEVVDELLVRLKISKKILSTKQLEKKRAKGGFKKGLVLLETNNPPPTIKEDVSDNHILKGFENDFLNNKVLRKKALSHPQIPEKWTDKRKLPTGIELKLRLNVPLIHDNWTASTSQEIVNSKIPKVIKGEISGKRNKSMETLDLSIFIMDGDAELFE